MNLLKPLYNKEKKLTRILLFGTIGSILLLAGACSFTTEMADDSVSPKLSLRGMQSDVTEVNVHITGQDYQRSVTATPSTSSIELFLPPGDDVKFEVEAANQDSATSHVYSWGMTRYADLVEGEDTEIDFTMGPKDTKIVIPDYFNYNPDSGPIVQVSNLDVSEDLNSLSADQFQTAEPVSFSSPYDTALDNQGRIWTSYRSSPISMINNITSSKPDYTASEVYGSAIAFDRINSYLYIVQPGEVSTIRYIHVTQDVSDIVIGTDTFSPSEESEIYNIRSFGLAVDNEGYLYFTGKEDWESSKPTIFKYDPQKTAGNRVVATYSDQDVIPNNFYMDLLVKNNHLYITNPNGPSGYAILKLTRDLQYVDSFGRVVDYTSDEAADQPGEFYGPTRFLATTADNIYLTDDAYNTDFGQSSNRIIRFKDIEGSDWKAYHPVSDGVDVLSLYFAGT